MKKYNYVYKIVNNVNNKYYIGCHQTDNIDDGYMGSGVALQRAINKYGIKNFTKTIIQLFDDPDSMFKYESELISNDIIKSSNNYNLIKGGKAGVSGLSTYIDNNNIRYYLNSSDPIINQLKLKHINVGYKIINQDGNDNRRVPLSYMGNGINTNKILCRDVNTSECILVDKSLYNPYDENIIPINKGIITVKTISGTYTQISKDEFELNKHLYQHLFTNRMHSIETKKKISKANKLNHSGSKNSQYGTCWIFNENGINKKINKSELHIYESNGWKKGRKLK